MKQWLKISVVIVALAAIFLLYRIYSAEQGPARSLPATENAEEPSDRFPAASGNSRADSGRATTTGGQYEQSQVPVPDNAPDSGAPITGPVAVPEQRQTAVSPGTSATATAPQTELPGTTGMQAGRPAGPGLAGDMPVDPNSPEASDPGYLGPPPEASDSEIMGEAPEATDPGTMGPAPEAGETGDAGPPPEQT